MTRCVMGIGLLLAIPAWVCTDVPCKPSMEMNARFTVEILADGRPVAGANLRISGPGGPHILETAANGKVVIGPLKKGDYNIGVDRSGLVIKSDCFRVSGSSNKGKRELKYTWGDYAISVVRLAGRMAPPPLTEPPKPNPSRVELPPAQRVAIHLMSTLTAEGLDGQLRTAAFDREGNFDFGDLPEGLYIARAMANRPFLIKVDRTAPWPRIEFWGDGYDLCDSFTPQVRAFTSRP